MHHLSKLSFMTFKTDAKFVEKLTYGLEHDMKSMVKFQQSTQKCQNWDFGGILFSFLMGSKKCMSLKFTEELRDMAMKNDAKFEEELSCRFKTDMRNLMNFDPSTQ